MCLYPLELCGFCLSSFLHSAQFILKRDLKWCPTFTKLKTLLLNEYWCVPDDFSALSCILQRAPVLGNLILQIYSKVYLL